MQQGGTRHRRAGLKPNPLDLDPRFFCRIPAAPLPRVPSMAATELLQIKGAPECLMPWVQMLYPDGDHLVIRAQLCPKARVQLCLGGGGGLKGTWRHRQ